MNSCADAAAIDVEGTDLLLNFSMISTQDQDNADGAASPCIGAVQSQQLDDEAMDRYDT